MAVPNLHPSYDFYVPSQLQQTYPPAPATAGEEFGTDGWQVPSPQLDSFWVEEHHRAPTQGQSTSATGHYLSDVTTPLDTQSTNHLNLPTSTQSNSGSTSTFNPPGWPSPLYPYTPPSVEPSLDKTFGAGGEPLSHEEWVNFLDGPIDFPHDLSQKPHTEAYLPDPTTQLTTASEPLLDSLAWTLSQPIPQNYPTQLHQQLLQSCFHDPSFIRPDHDPSTHPYPADAPRLPTYSPYAEYAEHGVNAEEDTQKAQDMGTTHDFGLSRSSLLLTQSEMGFPFTAGAGYANSLSAALGDIQTPVPGPQNENIFWNVPRSLRTTFSQPEASNSATPPTPELAMVPMGPAATIEPSSQATSPSMAGPSSGKPSHTQTSSTPEKFILCRWGDSSVCGNMPILAASRHVKAHLRKYHPDVQACASDNREPNKDTQLKCLWSGCRAPHLLREEAGLARHICTVVRWHALSPNLEEAEVWEPACTFNCDLCGKSFSRSDSVLRHRNGKKCRTARKHKP